MSDDPDSDVVRSRWTAVPSTLEEIDLEPLAEILRGSTSISEAWLLGNALRDKSGVERAKVAVAFVVDDASSAGEKPESLALMERCAVVASSLGIDVGTWAFVTPLTVSREIRSVGRLIASNP